MNEIVDCLEAKYEYVMDNPWIGLNFDKILGKNIYLNIVCMKFELLSSVCLDFSVHDRT